MRIVALFMCVLSVGSTGCVGWPAPTPVEFLSSNVLENENKERKRQDEIQIVAISTKPNGATTRFEYTFRKSGENIGRLYDIDSSLENGEPLILEFTAEIHDECLAHPRIRSSFS